jgi:broad-specificity NMP kinase
VISNEEFRAEVLRLASDLAAEGYTREKVRETLTAKLAQATRTGAAQMRLLGFAADVIQDETHAVLVEIEYTLRDFCERSM